MLKTRSYKCIIWTIIVGVFHTCIAYSGNSRPNPDIGQANPNCPHPWTDDTSKVNALIVRGGEIYSQHPDSDMQLWFSIEEIVNEFLLAEPDGQVSDTIRKYLAGALNNIAWKYENQGDAEKGLGYYQKSLKL